MPNRREVLKAAAGTAVALTVPTARVFAGQPPAAGFTLPKLPYAFDALEPHIDAETMTIHYTKHHQGYVNNLNKLLAGTEWATKPIEYVVKNLKEIPADKRKGVENNGGGHYNHSLFWTWMTPKKTAPGGDLLKAIEASFESMDKFKAAFSAAAANRFGSGWAWLVPGKDKPLAVTSSANQDTPMMTGVTPLLGLDVWEHAYYLKYRNLRAKYIAAWWNVVNWTTVSDRFAASKT
ncbi:MAG TPA: superoxide dismutase [Fimbriiglobus sp.]|jgi:Fe-Mn family superoxide dismutase